MSGNNSVEKMGKKKEERLVDMLESLLVGLKVRWKAETLVQ